jgi:hypothetical protein
MYAESRESFTLGLKIFEFGVELCGFVGSLIKLDSRLIHCCVHLGYQILLQLERLSIKKL